MKTVTIPVRGLDSAGCAVAIEKRLATIPSIASAEASSVTRSATITFDDTRIDVDALRALVTECGFACGEPLEMARPGDISAPTSAHAQHSTAQARRLASQAHRRQRDKIRRIVVTCTTCTT